MNCSFMVKEIAKAFDSLVSDRGFFKANCDKKHEHLVLVSPNKSGFVGHIVIEEKPCE